MIEELPFRVSTASGRQNLEVVSYSDQSLCTIESGWRSVKVIPWRTQAPPERSTTSAMTLDHYFLCWPAWSIYAALTSHGSLLGTTCYDCVQDGKSSLQFLHLPESLRPTPLQLLTPHRRWIDRFPFPRMRDNMILLSGLIDLEQFCGDLFGCASFTLRKSCPTWDPRSWIIGSEFSSKWGYLLL